MVQLERRSSQHSMTPPCGCGVHRLTEIKIQGRSWDLRYRYRSKGPYSDARKHLSSLLVSLSLPSQICQESARAVLQAVLV